MKRLGIYLVYDNENIINPYIGYMLKELKTCLTHLVVVCNMGKVDHGKEILEQYGDEIFFRDNIGFDAGGFKDALCSFLGWEKVLQYEELVLVNDSMYGPFCPMRVIFDQMEKRQVNFWGLAKHGEFIDAVGRCAPEHVQTYFMSISFLMLHDPRFEEYWETMPYYGSFDEVVWKHEIRFTQHFADLGYTYDVLADMDSNNSKVNIQNNYSQYALIPYELMKRRNFPFLKRRPLINDTLEQQTQENWRLALEYIDKETNYDVNLIWDHILRRFNMADLQRSLHLHYIIPFRETSTWSGEQIVVVVVAEYLTAVEDVAEYLLRICACPNTAITILSEKEEILEAYQNLGIACEKLDLRKKSFNELCMYDLVCILHDADMSSDTESSCTGKSYFYNLWENLLKDENHVVGIVNQFKNEPRLGFLAPPMPIFGKYFGELSKGWNGRFDAAKNLTEKLQLKCRISKEKPPLRANRDFWIRGSILKKLNDVDMEDYSNLEHIWTYIAQDRGYYSGIVESEEYASMNESNLYHYMLQVADLGRRYYGDFCTFQEMMENMKRPELERFCKAHKKNFIYGAGYFAKKYKKYLSNIEAYVISDGQEKPDRIDGIPVRYLSEVPASDEHGFVLCLSKEYQNQVIPILEKRGIRQYICI